VRKPRFPSEETQVSYTYLPIFNQYYKKIYLVEIFLR